MTLQPRLYVHCGFHKTGSTALQAALRASEEPLRQAGFLYPYKGSLDRPGIPSHHPSDSAHHNFSWEIIGKRLFDHKKGTLADLAAEAASFTGSLIISSEEFGSILNTPETFTPLQRVASNTGRQLVLIVYLRNQLEYCEALFQELLKHGSGKDYHRHAAAILETGTLPFRDVIHHFDYENALSRSNEMPDVQVIVRNYHALEGGSIITDFARLLGVEGILRPRPGEQRTNIRETSYDSLYRFYANRLGREPTLTEKLRIEYLAQTAPRMTSNTLTRQKFTRRFQASNLRLCETWGIPATGLDMTDTLRPTSEVTLEQFFSFETQRAIRSGTVPETGFAAAEAKATMWMAGVETADVNVPAALKIKHLIGRAGRYRRWYTSRIMNLILPRPSSELG
jgi:hypothetical protein